MKKRVLSIIISVCILCGMLSTTAFAVSCDGVDCSHVAAIGSEHFDSIQAAVDAAQNGDTIVVIRSHNLDCSTTTENALIHVAGKNITIDLNGCTVTADYSGGGTIHANSVLQVATGAKLKLTDSSAGKTGTLYAKTTVANETTDTQVTCLIRNATNNDNEAGEAGASLIVEGGNYQMDYCNKNGGYLFYATNDCTTWIKGGTFLVGNIGVGANDSPWIFNTRYNDANRIVVVGGTFNADVNHQHYEYEVYVPETKALRNNGNGTWTVVDSVAYMDEYHKWYGGKYTRKAGYATLENAIAAANIFTHKESLPTGINYETITLLKDYTIGETPVDISKNMKLELNGKTVNGILKITDKNVELTAPESLNVISGVGGYAAIYDGNKGAWILKPGHTVSFEANGGTPVQAQAFEGDSGSATEPNPAPTKAGYNFDDWYSDAELTTAYNFETAVTGDITLYAKWTPAQLTGTVTITGTVQVGETLTATVSESNNTGTLIYQWHRYKEGPGVSIDGADGETYKVAEADVGYQIYCVVSSDVQTGMRVSEKTGVVPNLVFPVGDISAEGYNGTYDGQAHGITVTVPEGAAVYYSTDGESYELTASPAYTNAGTYTVYYRVVKDYYDGVDGSAVVNISKANPTEIAWPTVKGTVYVNDNAVTLNDDGAATGVDGAALDGGFAVGTVDLTSTGKKTVTVTFTPADSTNYNTVEKADYQITVSNRPVYSEPEYFVAVDESANGSVQLSSRYAEYGQTVTVTAIPDKGYTLETLTVTDRHDREIELTVNDDGKYSFKMPASKVTVTATFMEDNTMLNYFTDVFASDHYYDAVLWAVRNGITNGTSDTTFSPNAVCTRAQVVTFLWRAAGCPEPVGDANEFDDVDSNAYYAKAVQWSVEQGITLGTGDNKFSPDGECTRAQFVTFLWRSQGSENAEARNPFVDVADGVYYEEAVLWAVEEAITNGTSADTFSPNADCTRGQIVTFLYRCLTE